MSRYRTRPKAWIEDDIWEGQAPLIPSCEVDEHVSHFTGLLDASGNEIWIDPRPIGFGRDHEW